MDPNETALELIARSDNRIQMVAYGRSEDDLRAVLTHDLTSIGSDGLAMDPDGPSSAGRPHPRSFGCYPRLLGRYVREAGLLTLERAIEMSHLAPRGPGRAGRSRSDRRGRRRGPRGLRPGHRHRCRHVRGTDAQAHRDPGGRRGRAESPRGRAPGRRQAAWPDVARVRRDEAAVVAARPSRRESPVIEFGFAVPPGDREMGRVDPATFAADLQT